MLKFFFLLVLFAIASATGYLLHFISAWLILSFLLKVIKGGGLRGGLQAVALKICFILVMIFSMYSDRVGGTTAIGLFLLGLAGVTFEFPTFKLSKQMQQGQAQAETDAQGSQTGELENRGNKGDGLLSVIAYGMKRK